MNWKIVAHHLRAQAVQHEQGMDPSETDATNAGLGCAALVLISIANALDIALLTDSTGTDQ